MPPLANATILHPADLQRGATDEEIRAWFAPHNEEMLIEFGDLAGRVYMPGAVSSATGNEEGKGDGGAAVGDEHEADKGVHVCEPMWQRALMR